MTRYRQIKSATADVVGVRLVRKLSTERAHGAIRDLIVGNPALSYQQIANQLGCSRWLICRVAVEFGVRRPKGAGSPSRHRGKTVKRRKYFDWEQAFHFIWQGADCDRIWNGDAASLAAEFDVSEDDAYSVLSHLCDRRLIERLYTGKYIIVNWREKDDPDSAS